MSTDTMMWIAGAVGSIASIGLFFLWLRGVDKFFNEDNSEEKTC